MLNLKYFTPASIIFAFVMFTPQALWCEHNKSNAQQQPSNFTTGLDKKTLETIDNLATKADKIEYIYGLAEWLYYALTNINVSKQTINNMAALTVLVIGGFGFISGANIKSGEENSGKKSGIWGTALAGFGVTSMATSIGYLYYANQSQAIPDDQKPTIYKTSLKLTDILNNNENDTDKQKTYSFVDIDNINEI